ncbi:MAG TPA: hypothetical protein VK988_16175 [Acidimicrobiales bacterium]|nr:hypothetical protein [Acidimicrobiales bacterium]
MRADTIVFWWPVLGPDVGRQSLPSVERGAANVVLELAGLVALAWAWQRFRLTEPEHRRQLLRTGRVGCDLAG